MPFVFSISINFNPVFKTHIVNLVTTSFFTFCVGYLCLGFLIPLLFILLFLMALLCQLNFLCALMEFMSLFGFLRQCHVVSRCYVCVRSLVICVPCFTECAPMT